jgi:SAM-dependent methyltransferase
MASDLVGVLAPKAGERILDLGCGTGHLAGRIAESGATVVGLDKAESMVAQARRNFPGLSLVVGDAADFAFDEPFDAVFSNAALHWMRPPEKVAACVARALKPGGRLVAEFGGKGNIARVVAAIELALDAMGLPQQKAKHPWYFPSVGEYASLLEAHGLQVANAALFTRPTPLEDGERGLANWMRMLGNAYLEGMPDAVQAEVIRRTEEAMRPACWDGARWVADYVRLRVVAVKS